MSVTTFTVTFPDELVQDAQGAGIGHQPVVESSSPFTDDAKPTNLDLSPPFNASPAGVKI